MCALEYASNIMPGYIDQLWNASARLPICNSCLTMYSFYANFDIKINPLHEDVECRQQDRNFNIFFQKNSKLKISLSYLESALKMHSNEYKQA